MPKPKILIVDDSKSILCLLEAILKKKFEVITASDGFMAMNWLLDGNKPDLIVTDLEMPNIDGIEFISHLSSSSYYEDIPILVLSGLGENEIALRCEKFKIAGYIVKPFDPVELLNMIGKILHKEGQAHKNNALHS